jgi:glutaredoxin 1
MGEGKIMSVVNITIQHILILGKSNCPYCTKAKELVESEGFNYKYIDIIAKGFTKKDLEVYTGCKVDTVPQIFINGKHIGGYTDLQEYLGDYFTFMRYN